MFAFRIISCLIGLTVVSLLCGEIPAQTLTVDTGGASQHSFGFRNSEHKKFERTLKTYSENFLLPPNTRLVGVDVKYTRREHVVSTELFPAPKVHYITAANEVTSDINKAAGVRVWVRLESGPQIRLIGIGIFKKPDPAYKPYDGVLEGTLTLRYTEGGSSFKRIEFVTRGGSRFVKGSGTTWIEHRPGGPSSAFHEVNRTENDIELFDAQRNMYVLLTPNRALSRTTPSEPWRPWTASDGGWLP